MVVLFEIETIFRAYFRLRTFFLILRPVALVSHKMSLTGHAQYASVAILCPVLRISSIICIICRLVELYMVELQSTFDLINALYVFRRTFWLVSVVVSLYLNDIQFLHAGFFHVLHMLNAGKFTVQYESTYSDVNEFLFSFPYEQFLLSLVLCSFCEQDYRVEPTNSIKFWDVASFFARLNACGFCKTIVCSISHHSVARYLSFLVLKAPKAIYRHLNNCFGFSYYFFGVNWDHSLSFFSSEKVIYICYVYYLYFVTYPTFLLDKPALSLLVSHSLKSSSKSHNIALVDIQLTRFFTSNINVI